MNCTEIYAKRQNWLQLMREQQCERHTAEIGTQRQDRLQEQQEYCDAEIDEQSG